MVRWPSRRLVILALVVLAGAAIYALRGPVLAFGLDAGARTAGYAFSYESIRAGGGELVIDKPDVRSIHGEPVFTALQIAVAYDLGHIFGGPHPFGVAAVDVYGPKLTYIHHRDGTSNITLPASSGSPSSAAPEIPNIRLALHDGSIGVIDDTRIFAHSRRLAIEDLNVSADLSPSAVSTWNAKLTIQDADGRYPVTGRGTLDPARGIELSRVSAKSIGLAALMDYALNSKSLHIANGVLQNIDARIFGLRDKDGAMARHVAVRANLDHFQPYLNGIAKPLRDGRGAVQVYDDGLAIPKVDGSIAGIPVRIAGGIYNLTSPQLRLGIVGNGDLAKLLTLADAGKKLAVTGPLAFQLFVEGDATQPMTLASFSSPRLNYGHISLDRPSGLVALHGPETAILRSYAGYDGIDASARGVVTLAKHTGVEMVANVRVPTGRMPFGADLIGAMPLTGTIVATGTDANIATSGNLSGSNGRDSLDGIFAVAGNGTGTVGPLLLDRGSRGSLYARAVLDRPGGGGSAIVSLDRFAVATHGKQPALPGMKLAPFPDVSGTLDGSIAVALAGTAATLATDMHAYGVRALGYPLDDLTARGTAYADRQHLDRLQAAMELRYRGALGPLARAAHANVAASGTVDIPATIVAHGQNDLVAQIHNARFAGARFGGIALGGLQATIGVRGKAVDVYGAQARVGDGTVVAQGSFGNGGTLQVTASAIDLRALQAAGLPVRGGTVSAVADIDGTLASPRMIGGVAATGASYASKGGNLAVGASTGLSYDRGTLGISNALVNAGPAVASLDGSVAGLQHDPKHARYAFAASVREADIASLAKIANAGAQYPTGTLDADVRVSGSGSNPAVDGNITIPEGSINGLAYRDATVSLAGDASNVRASRGNVTVGSSTIGFDASAGRTSQSIALHAPKVNLADFNDYFDGGDMLGGTGSIDARASNAPDDIATNGSITLARLSVHHFGVGDTRADWSTHGRTVHAVASLGGTTGRVDATGDVTLAATAPLRDALHRTTLSVDAHARDIDLSAWLPAAGIHAPVVGFVDGDATVRGTYPKVKVAANAAMRDGIVQGVAIHTASIGIEADRDRATIANMALAIDNLDATGSGYVGIGTHAPVDVTVRAHTADAAKLAKTLANKTFDAAGDVVATTHVTGHLDDPAVNEVVDATGVRYQRYDLPHAHAEVAVTGARATMQNTRIDFQKGSVAADASIPLQAHFKGVAAGQPLTANVDANQIDLAQFAAFFPKGTAATGTLDGRIGVVGTLDSPGLDGSLALANGSFVGPQMKSKISAVVAKVSFAQRTISLENMSATVGINGTIAANGRVQLASLRRPGDDAGVELHATSTNAVFDIPNLFKGRLDGHVDIARQPGETTYVTGNVAVSGARIPTTALLPKSGGAASTATPIPVAFDLGVGVGNDVRVQGGPVDVGAKGDLHLGGTLGSPALRGELVSTGGTLSFYRTFRVQYPSVIDFSPSDGVIPTIDATATTEVDSPPTDVTLHVTGPASQMNVDLESDPSYSREQILGLLVGAQALGAVSGVASGGVGGPQANPVKAAAEGQLGTLLTQNLLEPLGSQLGSAVGLSNLELNYQPGGAFGVGAQKAIGKNLNAVFAESFNYPPRESIGLVQTPNRATALQFTYFTQPGASKFQALQAPTGITSSNQSVTASEPETGSSGFSISVQKKFH